MLSFEMHDRDLLARIGRLETKSGVIETPLFLPVINPVRQVVQAKEMKESFGCEAVIANAYLIKKQSGCEPARMGVHRFLDFDGVIMTDSGAYQILAYGQVETTPEEIITYQEKIDTDIATILDLPTGWDVSKEYARHTVDETVKRAKKLKDIKKREEIAWVGPIQGGRYLDLVKLSAEEMAKLPFHIYALGSPTRVMEQYLFDLLMDMVLTAKMNLPSDRPFHLFGAGHPFMFSLAVALGCDFFDSAAYSIYAKEDRYMTESGTLRVNELDHLPCSCPICANSDAFEFRDTTKQEREEKLNRHNLYVCFSEMRRIKQAIAEGRMWEYLEMRAHGHPSIFQALKQLPKYSDYLEQHSPISKPSGMLFFSSVGLHRPEVARYRKRLFARYSPPKAIRALILLPHLRSRLYGRGSPYRRFLARVDRKVGTESKPIHICTYMVPFGLVPIELEEVYPLSQCEVAYPPDLETISYVADRVKEYLNKAFYETVIVVSDPNTWERKIAEACIEASSAKKASCRVIEIEHGSRLTKDLLTTLVATMKDAS